MSSTAEPAPSADTPGASHLETEQRWANAGENLAVLNFSEKACCPRCMALDQTASLASEVHPPC